MTKRRKTQRNAIKAEVTDIMPEGCWVRVCSKDYYLSFVDRYPQLLGASEEELKQITVSRNEYGYELLRWDALDVEIYADVEIFSGFIRFTKEQAERVRKATKQMKVSAWVIQQLEHFDETPEKSPETWYEKIRESLKAWWFGTRQIISIALGVSFSSLDVCFKILDYGIEFRIELPWCLNKLNPLCWLAKGIVHVVSKLTKRCVWWHFGKHKALELELWETTDMLAFSYSWSVHEDHWGHWTRMAIAGLELSAIFYDGRHWDHEKNAPQLYEKYAPKLPEPEDESEASEPMEALTDCPKGAQ
jgi:hypothetical protein